MIAGLPAGPYVLRYRSCIVPAGKVAGIRAGAPGSGVLRPGAPLAPVTASRGYVVGGQVTMLGPITVRPQGVGVYPAMPTAPSMTRFTAARLRRQSPSQDWGGVAGRVLGPHGRHVKGLCFNVYFPGGSTGGPIPADGRYNSGGILPPGKYAVGFSAVCDSPFGTSPTNWAPEWYRDKFRQSAANTVVVKAGKITRGLDGVMRPGGVISGTVTGANGRGLVGVCVVAATPNGDLVQQVTTPRSGRFRFLGLGPGRYGIGFFPHCGLASTYLPQWWPGTAAETKRGLIRTGFGTRRSHVDARMVLGGTISGVVRFRDRHGRPIKGMCVDATPAAQPFALDYLANTNAKGDYALKGLPAGRYSVSFGPGCDNNGNYLNQNYPYAVTARLARVTGNIDAYLQPGAIIRGTVTAKSDGAKLGGVCAMTTTGFAGAETGANGTYSIDQIPPGKTHVEFYNCSDNGNFAPQFYPDQISEAGAVSIEARSGQVIAGIDAALASGATISGTIALASGRKLSDVCTEAVSVGGSVDLGGGLAESDHGHYAIEDLAPGEYQVQYLSCGGPNVADVWFNGPSGVTGNETYADNIYVPAGGSIAHIDAILQIGGDLSGWVYGPASQQGSFVCEFITNARTGVIANDEFGVPLGDGYTIFGFAPGRYLVEFLPCSGQNLALQWYDRASRPAKATPVLVRAGHTTWNVDAWMTAGGAIGGRVVNRASGKPLGGVCVAADSVNQPFYGFGRTNRSGAYVVTGLNTGTYRLYLSSCGASRLVPLVTKPVRATVGTTVAGPDVEMVAYLGGAISGRVTAAGLPSAPATGTCVDAVPLARGPAAQLEQERGTAGPDGYYQIGDLVPGKYKIFFGDPNCFTDPGDLVPQWYKGTSSMSKATVISVVAGRKIQPISVTLQRDGSISGVVTGPKPADKPLAGICVQAVPVGPGTTPTPYLARSAAPGGGYSFGPLPLGEYLVEFEAGCGASGYAKQWWKDAARMSQATPVIVRAGRTRSGISAHMTPRH